MNKYQSPIFCNRCHRLALANLGGMPFCLGCLTGVLKTSGDPYLMEKIKPLKLYSYPPKKIAKSRVVRARTEGAGSNTPGPS